MRVGRSVAIIISLGMACRRRNHAHNPASGATAAKPGCACWVLNPESGSAKQN
jgi:hypothetical protein